MPGILLAQGLVDVPTPPSPPGGLAAMRWTGFDGRVFDLLRGNVVASGPIRGLNMPPAERFTTTAAGIAGSRHEGHRFTERECFWPLFVYHSTTQWVSLDSGLWETLRPDRVGVWTVTTRDGASRSLRCRYVDDSDHAFPMDPTMTGWAVYGVRLVAEWPYWQGAPVVRAWAGDDPVDFFGGTGGPPFFISSGLTLGSATVVNPGDVESWPVWTLTGPFDSAALGVGDANIEVPFAVADGVTLTIDSDPWGPTATLSTGEDVTGDISELGFAPIPPGAVDLSLELDGTGTVQVSITPNYLRAW